MLVTTFFKTILYYTCFFAGRDSRHFYVFKTEPHSVSAAKACPERCVGEVSLCPLPFPNLNIYLNRQTSKWNTMLLISDLTVR